MNQTLEQYQSIVKQCRKIFTDKTKDYGTSWRILRTSSLTDQIYIKAQRIRTIQETGNNKIGDDIDGEFRAIVNYCIMALIQNEENLIETDLLIEQAQNLYDKYSIIAFELMEKKNHDYGEAWRDMRVSSLTDLILMKLLRIKQIEDNDGKTIVSEGVSSNYYDILNYSIFALIHLQNFN
ncbi:MAG: DUF1599 domain-containing protein [Flavobacteriia bacterium]|nr:DUF1599 domain-containing protein [Flavobacteriia bacterium]